MGDVEAVFAASRRVFNALVTDLVGEAAAALTHSGLEDLLTGRARELTRQLFQDHLDLRALREERVAEVVDAHGVERTRIERGRARMLATVFGKVAVTRIAYRGTAVEDLHPADTALNLPAGLHSHGVAKLAAIEASRGSFDEACDRINALTGTGIGKRQVVQLATAAAGDIDAFYDALVPAPCTDTTLLVISVDGKGIVIRPEALREATAKAAAAKGGNTYTTRLASGEKNSRKRMATLGTVYDAIPAPRDLNDIIADPVTSDAAAERRPGPEPARSG